MLEVGRVDSKKIKVNCLLEKGFLEPHFKQMVEINTYIIYIFRDQKIICPNELVLSYTQGVQILLNPTFPTFWGFVLILSYFLGFVLLILLFGSEK